MDINQQGLFTAADFLPSPHHDSRPDEEDISLIILHNISLPPNVFGASFIEDFFLGVLPDRVDEHPFFTEIVDLKVSAHFLILRDGKIQQYVPTQKRAWHAGVSCYHGRKKCNDFSIGIELNGADHLPYTLRQYQSLAQLCFALMKRYPKITVERITTHSHVAPQRKTDPGPAFHHPFFQRLLNRLITLTREM